MTLYSQIFAISFNYLEYMILVSVKLDVSWFKEGCISRLQTSLLLLILNSTAKMKLAILAFLCSGEFVKNSVEWISSRCLMD